MYTAVTTNATKPSHTNTSYLKHSGGSVESVDSKVDEMVQCVTTEAADTIQHAAREKNDFPLLGKIAGVDLVAREARYHTSCRRNYTRTMRTHHTPPVQMAVMISLEVDHTVE